MVNPMSHMVRYLYPATVDDPVIDIDAMETALNGAGRNVNVRDRRSSADWPQAVGVNWVAGSVAADGKNVGIAVEVHVRDVSARDAWREVSELPNAPSEDGATCLCIVTLTGETRMDIFEDVQRYWTEQRGAAEWDEVSGFTV